MPKSRKAAPNKAAPTPADVELARAALLDITPEATVGEPAGSIIEADGVLTLYFDTTLPGYRGWKWTVSLLHGDDSKVSVLETELTPAEGALLAPDWVPWSERLAEYKAAQAELAAQPVESDDGDDGNDSDDFDDDDDDDDDFDDDIDGADFDGVDIDSLDESEGSVLSAVGDDKSKESEGKSDDAGPKPPVKARSNQRVKKQQQGDEGE